MNKLIPFFLIALMLAACAPSAEAIQTAIAETQAVWTEVPSQTSYPTYTNQPKVVITKLVTLTFTSTPEFTFTPSTTPSITPTPTKTNTKTPTLNPLKAMKGNGFYLVGVDIAPGVWRSEPGISGCYWSLTTRTGDIIDNHFGDSGGTAYISPYVYQVEFNDCGWWTFISDP